MVCKCVGAFAMPPSLDAHAPGTGCNELGAGDAAVPALLAAEDQHRSVVALEVAHDVVPGAVPKALPVPVRLDLRLYLCEKMQ